MVTRRQPRRLEVTQHRGGHVGGDARCHDGRPTASQLDQDSRYLLPGLSLAEDHFGKARAQMAVRVHPRESKIAEGQIAKLSNGVIHGHLAATDVTEQLPQSFGIHPLKITSAVAGCVAFRDGRADDLPRVSGKRQNHLVVLVDKSQTVALNQSFGSLGEQLGD